MSAIQEVEQLERPRFAAQISTDYAVLEKSSPTTSPTPTPTASTLEAAE
ncbi:MAG: hypothetical protein ACRYFR_17900 [Janthinobacterium lividum]